MNFFSRKVLKLNNKDFLLKANYHNQKTSHNLLMNAPSSNVMTSFIYFLMKKLFKQNKKMIKGNYNQAISLMHDIFSKGFRLIYGCHDLPHLKKRYKGGEDAFSVNHELLVIADGVGGWNHCGIDPALFSKELVKQVSYSFSSLGKAIFLEPIVEKQIRKRLQLAIDSTISMPGSSTVSLLAFDSNNRKVYSCYIGDSVYMIARVDKDKKNFFNLFQAPDQTHGFNIPFQVGKNCDSADSSKVFEHDLCNRDVIILATDGLWDNIFANNIIELLNSSCNKEDFSIDCDSFAKLLVEKADKVSQDK